MSLNGDAPRSSMFWFHRSEKNAGGGVNEIEGRIPDAAQQLTSDGGRYRSGTTLGSLELVNSDGEYDEKDSRWHWDGYPARFFRGPRRLSNDLKDFEVIADAIMGRPDWSPESFRMSLFDRSELLRKPVELESYTVKEGYTDDGNNGPRDRDNQEMPSLYGEHFRVTAYRVTADELPGGPNDYRFASDVANSVSAAYLTPDSGSAVAFTFTPASPSSPSRTASCPSRRSPPTSSTSTASAGTTSSGPVRCGTHLGESSRRS